MKNYIKGDNSVENHSIVLKFGTVIIITASNIFPSLISIEMLIHYEIVTNSEKYWPPSCIVKGYNSVENHSIDSKFGMVIVINVSNIFPSLSGIEMLTDYVIVNKN